MYIIVEWALDAKDAWILQDEDGDEASGNMVFENYDEALNFCKKRGKRFRVIEIEDVFEK